MDLVPFHKTQWRLNTEDKFELQTESGIHYEYTILLSSHRIIKRFSWRKSNKPSLNKLTQRTNSINTNFIKQYMKIHRNASAMSRSTQQDTHSLKEDLGLGQFDFLVCWQSETGAPRELTFPKHLTSAVFRDPWHGNYPQRTAAYSTGETAQPGFLLTSKRKSMCFMFLHYILYIAIHIHIRIHCIQLYSENMELIKHKARSKTSKNM